MSGPVYTGGKAVGQESVTEEEWTAHRKAFQREYELRRDQGDRRMELGQGEQETDLKGHGDRAKMPSCRCLPL